MKKYLLGILCLGRRALYRFLFYYHDLFRRKIKWLIRNTSRIRISFKLVMSRKSRKALVTDNDPFADMILLDECAVRCSIQHVAGEHFEHTGSISSRSKA